MAQASHILVTGAAGFIGGAGVHRLTDGWYEVASLDKLTCSANLNYLKSVGLKAGNDHLVRT